MFLFFISLPGNFYGTNMKYARLVILAFYTACASSAFATSLSDSESLRLLYALSVKNLNYGSSVSESEILTLCDRNELQARKVGDYDEVFRIGQISVNSSCLKGDLGLAINKARGLYEEAKKQDHKLGIALAIQSIGDTYMHAGQNEQALATFAEAEQNMKNTDDNVCKLRLLIQQLHVCMNLRSMATMQHYLFEARKILDRIDTPEKGDYIFYIQCYQVYYHIGMKDAGLAAEQLEQLRQMQPLERKLGRWYYDLALNYYSLTKDYEKALAYCDSTMSTVYNSGYLNEYKNLLMDKAVLLGKKGEENEACLVYEKANELADSLNMLDYSRQIDSLRTIYWVDQLALENTAAYNRMLTWVLLCGGLVLVIAGVLIVLARKQNRKLILSRKELEAKRKESEESIHSKSLFLSNMSHELRTPLNAIVGFAGLLSTGGLDNDLKMQCGDLVKQNSNLLLKLLNDVADLSALKDGNIRFTYVEADAVALCRNVVDTVDKVKQTTAQLYFSTTLEALPMSTDPGRLQQVLINLLINATKFTPEGSITLTLKMDSERNEVVFMVEDTGCGIPLERQPHIFERFEKLHEGVQGAGLGLSICQLIIEFVGGRIWIDSEYTQGARFVFTHPLGTDKMEEQV